jgi:uncharacterized membrane protein
MLDIWLVVPNVLEKLKPLGMTAKGAAVSYLFALVYIVLLVILGLWWNKHLPSSVAEDGWSSRTIARIAILTALSAAGGLITLPGATSIRFDSLAGYFGTLIFGWQIGAVVAAFGAFFSELMSGFSGWAPLAPYYMITMALAVTSFGVATKKFGRIPGIIVGTFVNTLCVAPWPLMMGWGMLAATIVQQVLGSYANCMLAAFAYAAITAAQTRRRYEEPVDEEELRIVSAMLEQDAKDNPGAALKAQYREKQARKAPKGAFMLFFGGSMVLFQVIFIFYKLLRTKKGPDVAFASFAEFLTFVRTYWVGLLGLLLAIWGLIRRMKAAAKARGAAGKEA